MTTVEHVLDYKGRDVHSIGPNESVFDALKRMADSDIGALVVLEDDRLVVQQAMLRQERDLVGCDVLSAELLEGSPDNRASARVKPRLLV